jgi:hypothetical protein
MVSNELFNTNPENYKSFTQLGYELGYLTLIQLRYFSMTADNYPSTEWLLALDQQWHTSSAEDFHQKLQSIIVELIRIIKNIDSRAGVLKFIDPSHKDSDTLIGMSELPINHYREMRKTHTDEKNYYGASRIINLFVRFITSKDAREMDENKFLEKLKDFQQFQIG